MQKYATSLQTPAFLIVVMSLLACVHLATAREPNEAYSDIPFSSARIHQLPLPSSEGLQLSSEQVNNPRLSDLLLLKQSLLDFLPFQLDSQDFDDQDQLDKSRPTKRVFCNTFTGCGGRHRGRRRQQPPVAEIGKRLLPSSRKRPFCNSYGCYNSGKKRYGQAVLASDASKVADFSEDWLHDNIKRLFCNSYGGCQNVGKRLLTLDADVSSTAGNQQRTFPFYRSLLEKLRSPNQVSSSNLEENVNSFLSVRRR